MRFTSFKRPTLQSALCVVSAAVLIACGQTKDQEPGNSTEKENSSSIEKGFLPKKEQEVLRVEPAEHKLTTGMPAKEITQALESELTEEVSGSSDIEEPVEATSKEESGQNSRRRLPYTEGEYERAVEVNTARANARSGPRPENPEDYEWFSPASGLPLDRNIEMGKLFEHYTANKGDLRTGMKALRPFDFNPLVNGATEYSGADAANAKLMPFSEVFLDVRNSFQQKGYVIDQLDRDMARWWLGHEIDIAKATDLLTDDPKDDWKVYASVLMLKGYPFAARYLAYSRVDSDDEVSQGDREVIDALARTAINTTQVPPGDQTNAKEMAEWHRNLMIAQRGLERLQRAWLKSEGNMRELKSNVALQEYLYSVIHNDSWGIELTRKRVLRTMNLQQLSIISASVAGMRYAFGYNKDVSEIK